MKIAHIAIWVRDLDKMKDFYLKYFNGKANNLYHNPNKRFKSYFISFDGNCRIELMQRPDVFYKNISEETFGLAHFAISVGNKETVNAIIEELRNDGFEIISAPRMTGDGYYEAVIHDIENNIIEITE